MKRAGWLAALTLLWLFTWAHSARAWLELAQYRYGWAIPPLALFIAHRRWRGEVGRCQSQLAPLLACAVGLAIFARGVCLAWVDPSWRLTGAMLTSGVVIVTAGWLILEGGRPLLRRQLFPLGFCFFALPWPTFIEHAVTLTLLKVITAAVVVFLNLSGIAAAQQGNVIELHHDALGMETACSGIESLQAALMAAVFLGELNRLRAARRRQLAGLAVLFAMAANFVRVSGLAWLMESSGSETEARFHDLAGGAATLGLFLALVLAGGRGARPEPRLTHSVSRGTGAPDWAGWGSFATALAAIAAAAITLTAPGRAVRLWEIDHAQLPPGWARQAQALTATERKTLRHGQEERWRFRSPDGAEAYVIYLRWSAGVQTDATAYPHSPALCLPSQGWTQEGAPDELRIPVLTVPGSVPFRDYHFRRQADRLIALQCLSSGSSYLPSPSSGQAGVGRTLRVAFYRRPQYVSEDLLIYLPGAAWSDADAEMVGVLVKAFRVGGG